MGKTEREGLKWKMGGWVGLPEASWGLKAAHGTIIQMICEAADRNQVLKGSRGVDKRKGGVQQEFEEKVRDEGGLPYISWGLKAAHGGNARLRTETRRS